MQLGGRRIARRYLRYFRPKGPKTRLFFTRLGACLTLFVVFLARGDQWNADFDAYLRGVPFVLHVLGEQFLAICSV